MVMDSKGRRHRPKGTPGAGRFATKAGANDSSDLQYDSLSETEFHEIVQNKNGDELEQFSHELPCEQGNYSTTGGGFGASPQNMKSFFGLMGVKPVCMGDRDYGEAATVENGKVRLYSGLHPRIPLLEVEPTALTPRWQAGQEINGDKSVLDRFAADCGSRRIYGVLPEAERVNDTTVRIRRDEGGYTEVCFDADTVSVTDYDEKGRYGLSDWLELSDNETVDDYMNRVADKVLE